METAKLHRGELEKAVEKATVVGSEHHTKQKFNFPIAGGVGGALGLAGVLAAASPVFFAADAMIGFVYGRIFRRRESYLMKVETESGRRFEISVGEGTYNRLKEGDNAKVYYEIKRRRILPGCSTECYIYNL